MFRRFWRRYDKLSEPFRIFAAMILISPIFLSTYIAEFFLEPYRPTIILTCVIVPFLFLITRWKW